MVMAYIKMYLSLGLGHLSIMELNELQKDINQIIRTKCDMILMQESDISDRIRQRVEKSRPFARLVAEGEAIDQEIANS